MPELCRFRNIRIYLAPDDHNPPHFHVECGKESAAIDIRRLSMTAGKLSRRNRSLVLTWARVRQQELLRAWDILQSGSEPGKIDPLP